MVHTENKNTIALVLFSNVYQDDSAIVSLAGKEGIFSVIAKSVYKTKSQFKPLLVSGSLVELDYSSQASGPCFAKSLRILFDSSDLMQDYVSSMFLLYLEETAMNLYEYGDSFPFLEVYQILKKMKERKNILSLILLYLGCCYKSLGIQLDTSCCVRCKSKKNIVGFSFHDGGFVCQNCLKSFDIIPKEEMELHILRYTFSDLNESILNKIVPKESGLKLLIRLNDNLISYFGLKPMKSFSMLLSALSNI